jgi:hypothetical protein
MAAATACPTAQPEPALSVLIPICFFLIRVYRICPRFHSIPFSSAFGSSSFLRSCASFFPLACLRTNTRRFFRKGKESPRFGKILPSSPVRPSPRPHQFQPPPTGRFLSSSIQFTSVQLRLVLRKPGIGASPSPIWSPDDRIRSSIRGAGIGIISRGFLHCSIPFSRPTALHLLKCSLLAR